jgi:hypothetical protein
VKRLIVAVPLAAGLIAAAASSTLALPPNPIRQAAHLGEAECLNPQGRLTHGAYVSFVAREYPVDPFHCQGLSTEE